MTRPAVFLDRDGVINSYAYDSEFGTFDSPARAENFHLLPGAGEAIASLSHLNLQVIVVSNQPGIAKGKFTPWQLDAINETMRLQLARSGARLDAVYYCRHHPEATLDVYRVDCDCRKPKPGLALQAARELGLDLSRSWMVGDKGADLGLAVSAGLRGGVLVLTGYGQGTLEKLQAKGAAPRWVAKDLAAAADLILAEA